MERFFEEFPTGKGKEKWMEEVLKDLKGKTYDKIWWRTYEGFDLEPYYKGSEVEGIVIPEDAPGQYPFVRSPKPVKSENRWAVCQEISDKDPSQAALAVSEAVKGGADAVTIRLSCEILSGKEECCCSPCGPEYSRGVSLGSADELDAIIAAAGKGTALNIEAGVASKEIFSFIEPKLGSLKGSIDNDPLKELALNGEFAKGEDERYAEAKYIFDKSKDHPDFRGMTVSGVHFHDAGASISQKIACMLSTAVFYKEKFADGISFKDFNDNTVLEYGVGQYYLLEIAGLRALRMLWSNIASSYGHKDCAPVIHAVTGLFNKTVYDPYVNMLRTATEAMSAVVGGCDSLTLLPYNVCLGDADAFGRRIARNTQLVLREESKLDRFVDPSKGSYFIEKATDMIAKKAWEIFLSLEKEGGILEALKKGTVQKDLEEMRAKRLSNFSMRKDSLVGTNHVPNWQEVSALTAVSDRRPSKSIFGKELYRAGGLKIEKIRRYRLSEQFEKLRMMTEKYNKENKKEVTAFLASFGNLTMRKARASFSMGFLAAGGFRISDNNGFDSPEEAAREALASGAEIIVICSSDEEYVKGAPVIAEAVRSAGHDKAVVLAGYPQEIVEDLKKAGVDEFIHLKSDSLKSIKNIQTKLGIAELN